MHQINTWLPRILLPHPFFNQSDLYNNLLQRLLLIFEISYAIIYSASFIYYVSHKKVFHVREIISQHYIKILPWVYEIMVALDNFFPIWFKSFCVCLFSKWISNKFYMDSYDLDGKLYYAINFYVITCCMIESRNLMRSQYLYNDRELYLPLWGILLGAIFLAF